MEDKSKEIVGLIGRHEKIEKIKLEIDSKQQELDVINDEYRKVNLKIQQIDEKIQPNKEIVKDLNIQIATLMEKNQSLNRELEKLTNLKENEENNIRNLEEQIVNSENEICKMTQEIEGISNAISSNQSFIDEFVLNNEKYGKKVEYLNDDILNLKISLSSFDESVASIDEMKQKISEDIENLKNSISKKEELLNNSLIEIDNLNNSINSSKGKIIEKTQLKKDYLEMIEKLKVSKEEISKRKEELEIKVLENVKRVEKIKEEKTKTENKKIKFELDIENLKNKMWDEYEATISSAQNYIENMPIIDNDNININKEAESLKRRIKELGDVDVSTIDEYNSLKERYDFISSQKNDLEETKCKLQNLINNMTGIMKSQFTKQFANIKQNFNETFKELFGGGKAELNLSDESNILESGIEIEVQPPGKKLQSMMLLSGGERALTATALLFAILKIKSPPFCILDEIEAALDDVNVNRFADYIKKYSKTTQFIVITHRKGTMEVASSVYGVTMQEYGISKVISMKLK